MHPTQKILLKRLLTQNNQKYSSLISGYTHDDNILFHLKKLIADGFTEKQNNLYAITTSGIKQITHFNLPDLDNSGFKTFFIGFLCHCHNQYLLKAHPQGNINFYNLPSGKPKFGEKIEDALTRTFFENTGLKLPSKNFK